MAESAIVSALLPLLFEKLASGAQQQLGKMLGVRRELGKLQSTLTTIQSVLRDAEEKEVKDAALRNWLEKLKNAAYDADDVLDEAHYELLWRRADIHHGFKIKVNDFFSTSHNPLFFRARMASKVKDIVERLDAIAKERSNFHLRIDGAATGERHQLEWRETHSYVIESEVIERGEDKRRIIEMLLSHESSSSGGSSPRVLPIVGMGGLGKTTLAQMVYNDEQMTAHFELCMWVCVSNDFNVPRLVKEIILEGNGSAKHIDVANMNQLQRKLRETIGSKRYLLVLDDVWNEDPQKWEELRVLLTFGGQGSTIIVTTRSDIVATIVGTIGPYRLAHLSEDGCWELFENKAFPGGVGKSPELVQIGKKISERCKGLPLAAKVIGSMMHLKTEEREWMNVLNSDVWEMQDRKDGIIPVLKLSYHQLHPHLKQCFAFCAIFPKDHVIDKEYLIHLWMANGLIPTEGRLELEEKGDYIFKELASRSFFQDIEEVYDDSDETTIITCKIHDLIHDLAQSIMGKDCVILNDEQLKRTSDNAAIRHLAIVKGTTSSTLNADIYNSCKTLRTLVVLADPFPMEVLYSIWSNLRSLRVLHLQGNDISDVPISVNNLKHLRYLDLSDTKIETLPEAISQLFYLQTLKIEECHRLRQLPKGMRNMCNLRHVYNGYCDELDGIPRGLGKLSQLQTLSMFVASERAGNSSIAELEDLNLGGKLRLCKLENVMSRTDAAEARLCSKKKIKSLELEWGFSIDDDSKDNSEEILEALRPHEEIQYLRISGYPGQQCPSWLVSSGLVSFPDDSLPALCSLRKLDIRWCERFTGGEKGLKLQHLTSLEDLQIFRCRALHSVNLEGLHRLRNLTISHCSKLYGLQGLTALRGLSLCDLATETTLPDWLPTLTGLESLGIINCPALTALSDGMEELTLLKLLAIRACPLLAGLPVGLQQRLPHLQSLRITGCPLLVGRCKEGGDYWHLVSSIPDRKFY